MTKALGIYNVVKLQQIFISPGKICKKDIVRRYVNWGSSCWVGGEVLLKKTEQIICTSAKPRAAEELYFSMISPDRQAEGELYTWVTVSPKGSSSLTGWRTKGWTGRDEAEGAEEEGAWRRRGGLRCGAGGHNLEVAVQTGCSSALTELCLCLGSPHSERIGRREPSWLHNSPLLCCVCCALFSKTQDGAATKLCNRCTCASRLPSWPSEHCGGAH